MLARQMSLTRRQVSNSFINARVRLWKPMVEESTKKRWVMQIWGHLVKPKLNMEYLDVDYYFTGVF
ncbi:unnamed protein product, partial [Vitis vinifera]